MENKFEDPAWLKETKHKRIVLAVPAMDQARVLKNITYKDAPGRDLQADVYLPPGLSEGETRPGVVFVHGGYLPPNLQTQPKDWGVFTSYGQLAAASGLVGITFNHRYYGLAHMDTAQADIWDLISYVRDCAGQFALDKNNMTLWAFSGGGPLISRAIRDAPPFLRTLVLYYTMLDVPATQNDPAARPEEKRKEFSPLAHVQNMEKDIFPMFIARAGLDRPALNETIDRFIQAALSKNMSLDVSNHAQGRHGFDVLDDNERSRQIIQRTLAFIRFHTGLDVD